MFSPYLKCFLYFLGMDTRKKKLETLFCFLTKKFNCHHVINFIYSTVNQLLLMFHVQCACINSVIFYAAELGHPRGLRQFPERKLGQKILFYTVHLQIFPLLESEVRNSVADPDPKDPYIIVTDPDPKCFPRIQISTSLTPPPPAPLTPCP